MKNKLIWLILSLLGFSTAACNDNSDLPCEYGTPHVTFSVKGKVQNKAGEPIPGIEVSTDSQYMPRKTQTNEEGVFVYEWDEWPQMLPYEVTIEFRDTDGAENGAYADRQLPVTFDEKDQTTGASGWSEGTFAVSDLEVTLDEITPEEGGSNK